MMYVRYSTHLTLRRDEFIDWYFTRSLRFRLLVFFFELKQKLFFTKFCERGVMPSLVPTMCRTISMALYFSFYNTLLFWNKNNNFTHNFDLTKGKQDPKFKTLGLYHPIADRTYHITITSIVIIFRLTLWSFRRLYLLFLPHPSSFSFLPSMLHDET